MLNIQDTVRIVKPQFTEACTVPGGEKVDHPNFPCIIPILCLNIAFVVDSQLSSNKKNDNDATIAARLRYRWKDMNPNGKKYSDALIM